MEERINRREFLGIASGLVTTVLMGEPLVFADYNLYKTKKEDLYEESLDILLARLFFGEGRSVSKSEKITIGFTPINRAKDNKSYTGKTIREAILKTTPKEITDENGKKKTVLYHKYNCFNLGDSNLRKLLNPVAYNYREWKKCLRLSRKLLAGKYDKWNFGPTHYHGKYMDPIPSWAKKMKRLDSTGFKHQFYRER